MATTFEDGVSPITGSSWISAFEVADDGDPRDETGALPGWDALANRTYYLYRLLTGGAGAPAGITVKDISASTIVSGSYDFLTEQTAERSDWMYIASNVFGGNAFADDYVEEALMGWDANSGHEIPVLSFRPRNAATPTGDPIYSKVALLGAPIGWKLHSVDIVSEGTDTFTGSDVRPTFEIGRWSGSNLWTSMSSITNDTHAADGSDWEDRLITTVTASANTVSGAFRYGVKIKHPRAASSFGYRVMGFKATYKGTSVGL